MKSTTINHLARIALDGGRTSKCLQEAIDKAKTETNCLGNGSVRFVSTLISFDVAYEVLEVMKTEENTLEVE